VAATLAEALDPAAAAEVLRGPYPAVLAAAFCRIAQVRQVPQARPGPRLARLRPGTHNPPDPHLTRPAWEGARKELW
jgi:hypothetical protein